jgi:hypothetical protein
MANFISLQIKCFKLISNYKSIGSAEIVKVLATDATVVNEVVSVMFYGLIKIKYS